MIPELSVAEFICSILFCFFSKASLCPPWDGDSQGGHKEFIFVFCIGLTSPSAVFAPKLVTVEFGSHKKGDKTELVVHTAEVVDPGVEQGVVS